jgi:glycosyltransferase involved in cell wall biosynthesis
MKDHSDELGILIFKDKNPYSATFKVYTLIAKKFLSMNKNIKLFVHEVGNENIKAIKNQGLPFYSINDLKKFKGVLLIDDWLQKMKLVNSMDLKCRILNYLQILGFVGYMRRLTFPLARLYYISQLRDSWEYIANSRATLQIFQFVTTKSVKRIIYPPIADDFFLAYGKYKKEKRALLFLERPLTKAYVERILLGLRKILSVLHEEGFEIFTFGSYEMYKIVGFTDATYERYDDNALARLYASSEIFITFPEIELFGLTPIESMAAGTPPISLYPHELIKNGKNGYTCYSVTECLKIIRTIARNGLSDEMIKNARKTAHTCKSERFIKELLSIL